MSADSLPQVLQICRLRQLLYSVEGELKENTSCPIRCLDFENKIPKDALHVCTRLVGRDRGMGARENRGQEGYGRPFFNFNFFSKAK